MELLLKNKMDPSKIGLQVKSILQKLYLSLKNRTYSSKMSIPLKINLPLKNVMCRKLYFSFVCYLSHIMWYLEGSLNKNIHGKPTVLIPHKLVYRFHAPITMETLLTLLVRSLD